VSAPGLGVGLGVTARCLGQRQVRGQRSRRRPELIGACHADAPMAVSMAADEATLVSQRNIALWPTRPSTRRPDQRGARPHRRQVSIGIIVAAAKARPPRGGLGQYPAELCGWNVSTTGHGGEHGRRRAPWMP